MGPDESGEEAGLFGVPDDQRRDSPAWARDGVKKTYMGFAAPRDIFEEPPTTEGPPPVDALSGSQAVDLYAAGAHEPAPRVGDQTAVSLDMFNIVQSDQSSSPGISLPDDSVVHPKRILTQDDFELLNDWIAPFDDEVITLDDKVGIGFNASQYDQMGKVSLEDRKRPGGIALGYLLTNGHFELRAIFQGTHSSEFQLGWHTSVPHNAVAMVQAIWPLTGGSHRHVRPYSDLELPKAAPIGLPMVCAYVGAQGGFEVYKTANYRSEEEAKEVTQRRWLFFQQKQIIAQAVPESFSVRRSLYGPTGEVLVEEDALMVKDDPHSFTHWSLQIGGEREDPGRIGDRRDELLKRHYSQSQTSSQSDGAQGSVTQGKGNDDLEEVFGREGEDAGKSRKDDPHHKTTRRTIRAKKGVTGQWELPDEAQALLDSQGMDGAQVMESPLQGRGDMPDIRVSLRESPTPAQGIKPGAGSPSSMGDNYLDGLLEMIHASTHNIHERYIPDPEDTQRPYKPLGQGFYKADAYHLLPNAGSETRAIGREELRKGEGFHKKVARTSIFIKSKVKPAISDVLKYEASDERFAVNIVSDASGTYIDVGEMGENPSKGLVPSGTVIYIPSDAPDAQELVDGVRKDPLAFARAYDSKGFPAWVRGYVQGKQKEGLSDLLGDSGHQAKLAEKGSPTSELPKSVAAAEIAPAQGQAQSHIEVGEPAVITAIRRESSLLDHTMYKGTEFMGPSTVAAVHYDGTIIDGRFIKQYRLINPLSTEFDSASRLLTLPDVIISDRDEIDLVMRRLNTNNNEYLLRFGDAAVWGTKQADDFEVRSWVDQRSGIIGVTYHSLSASRVPVAKVTSAKILAPNDLLAAFKGLAGERQTDVLTAVLLEDIFKDYAQS